MDPNNVNGVNNAKDNTLPQNIAPQPIPSVTPEIITPIQDNNAVPSNTIQPQTVEATLNQPVQQSQQVMPQQVVPQPSTQAPVQTMNPVNQAQNNVPNLNNAYLDNSPAGITFGVWSILTSIIPIVGFCLGITAIIKGFFGHHKNKTLGVLGIIGIFLSIAFFVLAIFLLSLIDKPVYGELKTKSGTLSGQYSDSGYYDYSFGYPADFTMTDVPLQNAVVYEDISDVSEENSVSKIILVVEELEVDSPLNDERIFETELGKQTIKNLIADTLAIERENTIITKVDTEYNALFGDAVLFEYTSIATPDIEVQGSFVFVFNKTDSSGYNFFLGSNKEVWSTNIDVFTEIRDSLNNK